MDAGMRMLSHNFNGTFPLLKLYALEENYYANYFSDLYGLVGMS